MGLHGQLGWFCWDILSESVYILLEQESLLLDGKNTLIQNHLQKEQSINSYHPSWAPTCSSATSVPPSTSALPASPSEAGFMKTATALLSAPRMQRMSSKALYVKERVFELGL